MRRRVLGCLVCALVVSVVPARAACSGSSPTRTAASASQTDVTACITAASNGDTINVPAGSVTWASQITLTKNLAIIGAGVGQTTVSGGFFFVQGTTGARISGFTSTNLPANGLTLENSSGYRIDHWAPSEPSAGAATTCALSYSTSPSVINAGLFDHLTATYCQFETYGADQSNPSDATNQIWANADPEGTVNAVFYEDSTFTYPDPAGTSYFNCFDALQGGSYVIRFATLDGCRTEAHGIQQDTSSGHPERGTRTWEIYYVVFQNTGSSVQYRPFLQRSGTGKVFHNTLSNDFLHNVFSIDTPRAVEDSLEWKQAPNNNDQVPVWQFCDGTTKSTYLEADGTTSVLMPINKTIVIDGAGTGGYPCRDGIGRVKDDSLWASTGQTTTPPAQSTLAPLYAWKNVSGGSELNPSLNCETATDFLCTNTAANLIVQNRDYYQFNASFTGTSGVGEGTLAARPATCTTGVGYWATDQGSWNASASNAYGVQASGADGVLYQCTSTNTWSAYYTPYTYPHPLQGATPAGAGYRLRVRHK